jgi:hypothetical protein
MSCADNVSPAIQKMEERIAAFGKSSEKIVPAIEAQLVKMGEKLAAIEKESKKANEAAEPKEESRWIHFNETLKENKERFGELKESASGFGEKLADIFPMLAGLGAVGSVGGIFELAHKFAENTEALSLSADKIGVTTAQLQRLDYAAKQTGLETDSFNDGLLKLDKNLGAAGAGKNKDLVSLLAKLHVNLRDTKGNVIDAADALPALENAFYKTQDAATRAFIAQTAFGKSGMDMIPFLDQGPAKIAALQAQFAALGYTPTDKDSENTEKFNESWKMMQTAVSGFTDELGAKLLPVLNPIIDQMTQWIAANRDWISTDIAGAIQEADTDFTAWLNSMGGIKGISTDLKTFGGHVHDIVHDLGGVKTIGAALGIAELVSLAPGMFTAAKAIKAVSVALYENPIVAVLGAIAISSYEIYEHWSDITGAIQGAIDKWEKFSSESTAQQNADVQSDTNSFVNSYHGGRYGYKPSTPLAPIPKLGGGGGGGGGKIQTEVTFTNTPPGTSVRTVTSGNVSMPKTKAGYSTMSRVHE